MSSDERLQVEVTGGGDAAVVRLAGEIDLTNAPMLRERLGELIEADPARVLFEMSGVHYIDSSGIGTLVEFKRRYRRGRGMVVLVAVQPRVQSLLEITRLDKFFTLAASLDEGRGS
jgi:anti-anti-sigma factor